MEKYNLKFLIPPDFANFDLLKPMGPGNLGGGVALKYARVEEAGTPCFNCKRISLTNEIQPDDIVFVDWMWFCVIKDDAQPVDRVKAFIEIPNHKIIYGSEFCVSSMPRQLITSAVEKADMVLHNSNQLRNLYRTIGIHDSWFLSDPVPPIFAPSMFKTPRLICVGQISEAKNTEAAITIFEGLEGTGIERYFLGGMSLWGDIPEDKGVIALQNRVRDAADVFIENGTQEEVAKACNGATFYAHFAIHDVSSYAGQENMSAGNIVFGLTHPILRERTQLRFDTPESLTKAIADYSLDAEDYHADVKETLRLAHKWSYEAWRVQMSDVLGRLC